jgi:dTDP-4-dehydrorhamnose reductase
MNILIVGRRGQLAVELSRADWPLGTRLAVFGREELDVTARGIVAERVAEAEPDVVINASGYTAVDRAEAEPDAAYAVNCAGVQNLATEAAKRRIPLIHVSTDYVFGGTPGRPWREDDEPCPAGVYACSKLAGEEAVRESLPMHIILRTSWVFAAHGHNFVRTMLRLGAGRETVRVVDDQIGCPTPAAALAQVIAAMAVACRTAQARFGTYHYAGAGPVSWHDFAKTIFALAGDLVPRPPILQPISATAFGAQAPRPAYSALDCGKIERDFGIAPAPWLAGLEQVLSELRSKEMPRGKDAEKARASQGG